MVTRNISFAPSEFYHIYNRGTDKRLIFIDSADYRRFTELLYLSNSSQSFNVRDIRKKTQNSVFDFDRGKTLVEIGAYCLMPNHFHILLKSKEDDGISKFMNKLGTSYSMYFNRRYERTGILFQGRYKAKHVESDEYLKYLFSYIHLNPIKIIDPSWKERGLKDVESSLKYLYGYKFSSFLDFPLERLEGNSGRIERKILSTSAFPVYFLEAKVFEKEIFEWLSIAE